MVEGSVWGSNEANGIDISTVVPILGGRRKRDDQKTSGRLVMLFS